MRLIERAYLAGLIDGEGCIAVSRTRTGASAKSCTRGFAYRSSVSITMTDLQLLKWCQRVTGAGRVCRKKVDTSKHRPAWTWAAWSQEAAGILTSIEPLLRLKRRQARNLIAFQSRMRLPGSRGLTDVEWRRRERHYIRSKTLNQRGTNRG